MNVQNKNTPILPSNRRFGWFFSVVFFIVSAYGVFNSLIFWAGLFFLIAFTIAILTITAPSSLTVFNKLWFKLGLLISRVVSPIVLRIIFYLIIAPTALITRLFGRDVLRIKKRAVSSHWIDRTPSDPNPASFKKQF